MEITRLKTWWLSKAGLFICLLPLLFSALPAVAGEMHPKLRATLKSAGSSADIPVIIRMAERADIAPLGHGPKKTRLPKVVRALKEKAEKSQQPVRDFLRKRGAKKEKSLWIINGLAATVTPKVAEELAALPGVESVRLDEAVPVPAPLAGTAAAPEWNLTAVHAPDLWALGYTGQGVIVANMDTGVDPNHPDLAGKWRGGTNSWYDPNGEHAVPYDNDGHGTGTMGVMVGGSAGGSAIGMAPDARWIAVKIFDDKGFAPLSAIHAGFGWLLDPDGNPDTNDAPDVVNNSWGLDGVGVCDQEFLNDVHALKAAAIAVVFAAGNSGPSANTGESPGNYPESFAVGAVNQSLAIAPFSSRGPSSCGGAVYPAVAAPGVNIRLADLTFGGAFPNSYTYLSGTSFAAPHVAGAMALLLSAFPALSVPELETALSSSTTDLGTPGPDNDYGQGLLNVLAAYNYYNPLLDISVTPFSHNFGTVNVGSVSPPRTFSITNRGSLGLAIDSVTISGSGVGDFMVSNDSCSGTTLPPGELCTLDVVFNPLSEGSKNVNLVVTYNDPAVNSLSIPLRGSSFTAVTLLAPNGGEVIPSGSHFQIEWGAPAKAANFNLAYSVNNGSTWLPIAAGIRMTGTSFDWPVPAPIANRRGVLVRVRGFTSDGTEAGRDRSDVPFAIEVVKLASPNGGESLTSREVKTITWTTNATKRTVASVRLWYTLNGGVSWQPIKPPLSGNPGSYNWTVPVVSTARDKCRVRVVLRDWSGSLIGSDASDAYFSIQPP